MNGVEVRRARAVDLAAVQAFVRGLSLRTRARRFFAPLPELPAPLADALRRDERGHHFVVATTRDDGVVALAQWAPAGPACAELALVIADAWQGQGLGRRLMQRLLDDAPSLGVRRLVAETASDNHAMQALLRGAGFELQRHPDDPQAVLAQRAAPAAPPRRSRWRHAVAAVMPRLAT